MGYCISVCIEKGGVGKTVTVTNMAALMAQNGKQLHLHADRRPRYRQPLCPLRRI